MKIRRCKEEYIRAKLLSILDGHVFHVTSNSGYAGIVKQGKILNNHSGVFPFTHNQSKHCYGNAIGGICLLDFRHSTDWDWGACTPETILNPHTCNNRPIFLILSEDIYQKLIPWNAAKEMGPNQHKTYVPYVECWYQGEIPIDNICDAFMLIVKPRERNIYWPKS